MIDAKKIITRLEYLEDRVQALEDKTDTEIIGVQELCEWLNLKERTVYLKVANKSIPYYKDGKKIYFKRTEIINNMEKLEI
jgi:excisionase family DNA binding protein